MQPNLAQMQQNKQDNLFELLHLSYNELLYFYFLSMQNMCSKVEVKFWRVTFEGQLSSKLVILVHIHVYSQFEGSMCLNIDYETNA